MVENGRPGLGLESMPSLELSVMEGFIAGLGGIGINRIMVKPFCLASVVGRFCVGMFGVCSLCEFQIKHLFDCFRNTVYVSQVLSRSNFIN